MIRGKKNTDVLPRTQKPCRNILSRHTSTEPIIPHPVIVYCGPSIANMNSRTSPGHTEMLQREVAIWCEGLLFLIHVLLFFHNFPMIFPFLLFHSFPFCLQSSILKIPQGANSKTLLHSFEHRRGLFFPSGTCITLPKQFAVWNHFSHSVYTEQEVEVDSTNRQGDANELEKVKDTGRELSNHMIQTRNLDNEVAMKVHKMEICKMKMCSSGIGNGFFTRAYTGECHISRKYIFFF